MTQVNAADLVSPSANVSLLPILDVIQAATGLMPRVRKMTMELVKEASALDAWNVDLMEGRTSPKESLMPLSRKWMRKEAATTDHARHAPSMSRKY